MVFLAIIFIGAYLGSKLDNIANKIEEMANNKLK